jgi:hypothetical protein
VTPSVGLLNPNHFLAVAIGYLLTHRPKWSVHAAVGKTLVSSSLIDRVVQKLGRRSSVSDKEPCGRRPMTLAAAVVEYRCITPWPRASAVFLA